MRHAGVVLFVAAAWALRAGPALAQEAEEHAKSPFNPVPMLVVAVVGLVIPLLFVIAGQIRLPSEDDSEEIETVVAGIAQGAAPVPRWLYLVYLLVPAWALFYLMNNVQVRSELAPAPPASTPAPVATPAPTSATPQGAGPVRLVAKDLVWDKTQIALSAEGEVVVEMRNNDASTPHNFALYTTATLETPIFKGELITGPASKTYRFPAPKPGTYHFQCDVHPTTMAGTATVG